MNLPSKNPALATAFPSYDAAEAVARKIRQDDPDWIYCVNRMASNRFVIAVFEDEGDGFDILLGYL
jgi:hypothetical protein